MIKEYSPNEDYEYRLKKAGFDIKPTKSYDYKKTISIEEYRDVFGSKYLKIRFLTQKIIYENEFYDFKQQLEQSLEKDYVLVLVDIDGSLHFQYKD